MALAGALAADTVEQAQDIVEQGFAVAHIAALVQEAARIVVRVPAAVDTVAGIAVVADTAGALAVDTVAASALVAGNTEQELQPVAAGRTVGRKALAGAGALLQPLL